MLRFYRHRRLLIEHSRLLTMRVYQISYIHVLGINDDRIILTNFKVKDDND